MRIDKMATRLSFFYFLKLFWIKKFRLHDDLSLWKKIRLADKVAQNLSKLKYYKICQNEMKVVFVPN